MAAAVIPAPGNRTSPSLWGSGVCVAPPCDSVEGEEALLLEMRNLLGPFASDERLTVHLRAVRGKVSWAVNRYLREELMSEAYPDFHPKPSSRGRSLPAAPSVGHGCGRDEQHLSTRATTCSTLEHQSTENACQAEGSQISTTERTANDAREEPEVDWLRLPEGVLDAALSHLNHQDLCQVAASCKELHKLAHSDFLWKALYEQRWGSSAVGTAEQQLSFIQEQANMQMQLKSQSSALKKGCGEAGCSTRDLSEYSNESLNDCSERSMEPQDAPSGSMATGFTAPSSKASPKAQQEEIGAIQKCGVVETIQEGGWRGLFHRRLACEHASQCPQCAEARFVPIVYGFPSGRLVVGLREERLVLGGDHLIDYPGTPLWACLGCGTQWRAYPYSKEHDGARVRPILHQPFAGWGPR